MIYNAGRLNRKVAIYKKAHHTTKDAYGFSSVKKEKPVMVSAWINPKRGKEYMQSGVNEAQQEVVFTIRFRPWVTEDCEIEYQNIRYQIKAVIDPDMRHESLEIYATRTYRGSSYE